MAIHYFVCDKCSIGVEDTNTKIIHKCPKCNRDMRWDLDFATHGNYKHPVHSDALAISPTQIAEHEQKFPNIRLDKACRPIFDNFTQHEKYLKDCNVIKHTQKIKVKGKRIA
ncbi:hypothetical protein KA005_08790 [bacterium]|nr:hypothetical protein [bacterium]